MGKKSVVIGIPEKAIKVFVQEWDGNYGRKRTMTVYRMTLETVYDYLLECLKFKLEGRHSKNDYVKRESIFSVMLLSL